MKFTARRGGLPDDEREAMAFRDARIESRFRAGQTMLKIAMDLGIGEARVCQILKERGVPRTAGGRLIRAKRRRSLADTA